jgi:hypothetical protein
MLTVGRGKKAGELPHLQRDTKNMVGLQAYI